MDVCRVLIIEQRCGSWMAVAQGLHQPGFITDKWKRRKHKITDLPSIWEGVPLGIRNGSSLPAP
jgi:hypothetical protein